MTPSGDVKMAPPSETAANWVPDQTTDVSSKEPVPAEVYDGEEVRYAQFDPNGVSVTVNRVLPDTPPAVVAVIVDVPVATPVASPLESIVPADGVPEVHATPGRTSDVPSEKCPVAVNCTVAPGAMPGSAGLTVID